MIEGASFLRERAVIGGALTPNGAVLGAIVDDPPSWPPRGDLLLDRCRYGAFIDAPTDAATRLAWLDRQVPARWGEDLGPQPYERLAKVLGEVGHDEDVTRVLIAKERQQRRARRRGSHHLASRSRPSLADRLLGSRRPRPGRTRGPGGHPAERAGGAALARMGALRHVPRGLARPEQTQLACYLRQPEAAAYPAFNPWTLSLEALLPALELKQEARLAPATG